MMKGRVRAITIGAGAMIVTLAVTILATAGSGAAPQQVGDAQSVDPTGVPEGPFIDFCPTLEQIEAHLVKYGFDYKPTVACAENGEEVDGNPGGEEPVDEEELFAAEKQQLLSSTRAPDTDGDPLSVEIILPNGDQGIIQIEGNRKFFEGMTLEELAEVLYP